MTRSPDRDATDEARIAQAARWSARLAEGALGEAEERALEQWLDADPRNGAAIAEIAAAWRAVEEHATAPELMDLRSAALDSARRAQRGRWARAILGANRRWMTVAATLLLLLAVGAFWHFFMPRSYETGLGERRVVLLADGSSLSLDAATKVRVLYDGSRRRLWLDQGRAKFDVAKDPLRPFSVEAAGRLVVATGTSFSVERLQRQFRVVLYEGSVAVMERPQGEGPARPLRVGTAGLPAERALKPGRELIATTTVAPAPAAAPAPVTIAPADPVRSLSWEGGKLVFEDEPLATAVERINRYAETPLIIGDGRVAAVRISGVFNAGDVEAFTDGLTASFPIQAYPTQEGIRLLSDKA